MPYGLAFSFWFLASTLRGRLHVTSVSRGIYSPHVDEPLVGNVNILTKQTRLVWLRGPVLSAGSFGACYVMEQAVVHDRLFPRQCIND
jgi:hypothetical protein